MLRLVVRSMRRRVAASRRGFAKRLLVGFCCVLGVSPATWREGIARGEEPAGVGRRLFGAATPEGAPTARAPEFRRQSGVDEAGATVAPRSSIASSSTSGAAPRRANSRSPAPNSRTVAYGPSTMSEQDMADAHLLPITSNRTFSYHYPWYYGTVAGAYSPAHYAAYRTYYYLYGLPYYRWGWGGWGWGGWGLGGWGGYPYGGYYGRYASSGYYAAGPYAAPYSFSYPLMYGPRAYGPAVYGPTSFGGYYPQYGYGGGLGWGLGAGGLGWGLGAGGPGGWGAAGAPGSGGGPGYAADTAAENAPFAPGDYYGPLGYRGFFW